MKAISERVERFTAYPRLHFGLLDLSDVTQRRYGGVGVLLDGPCTQVSVTEADEFAVSGCDAVDNQTVADIHRLADRLQGQFGDLRAHVQLERVVPQHVGLGSKTSLMLAIVACLCRLKSWRPSRREMQDLSGRGGTSGIGVHVFFDGGLVADGGHARGREGFRPSGSAMDVVIPPLIAQHDTPTNWRFILVLPDGARQHAAAELSFFESVTPIPAVESLKSIAACYHGVIPAFVLRDLGGLALALDALHEAGFKRLELKAQASAVSRLYHSLRAIPGVAVGMSSLGPLLYVVHDESDQEAMSATKQLASRDGAAFLGSWRGRNVGLWQPA